MTRVGPIFYLGAVPDEVSPGLGVSSVIGKTSMLSFFWELLADPDTPTGRPRVTCLEGTFHHLYRDSLAYPLRIHPVHQTEQQTRLYPPHLTSSCQLLKMSVVAIVIIIIPLYLFIYFHPHFKMKDPRPRRLKELAQSHRFGKLRYRDLTPGYQSPEHD